GGCGYARTGDRVASIKRAGNRQRETGNGQCRRTFALHFPLPVACCPFDFPSLDNLSTCTNILVQVDKTMPLRAAIDPSSPVPLHAQIAEAVQLAIATGELSPGEQLPTVRQLSVELRVNSNTVARVYAELERVGVLETCRGRGTFVRDRPRVSPGAR